MARAIHFKNPPLNEVVCGVHFTGVRWSDIHFGLFYTKISERYDQTRRRPHLSVFDEPSRHAPITFVTEPQSPLLWYEAERSPFLLQVQEDAFLLNWRGQLSTTAYPHFRTRVEGNEGVWDRFVREWRVFCDFCQEEEIGTPEVLACHLAYIDHMVHGESWDVPTDLAKWVRPLEGLKNVESVSAFNITIQYKTRELPIRVNIRPAVRRSDQKKLFIMDFITTEKLSAESSLEDWFQQAHDVIVQEFLAHTTPEAHDKWGLSYE